MRLPCPVPKCSGTMPGHLRICGTCSGRLLRGLADVPSLDRHLDLAITRQARLGASGARGRETPLPWDERAREAATILSGTLVAWADTIAAGATRHHGPACRSCVHASCARITLTHPPGHTPGDVALWLLRHRARLLARHDAADAADEIHAAIRHARRAIDRAPDRIYAGPCGQCDRDLYARLDADKAACPCGAEYDVASRRDWMLGEVREMLGSASWVAAVACAFGEPVTPSAVRGMASRLRITARGRDSMGRPTYRVGDVLDARRRASA